MPPAVNRGEVPGKVRMHFPAHPEPARAVGATRRPAVSAPQISSHISPKHSPTRVRLPRELRVQPRRAGTAGTAFPGAGLRQETSLCSGANSRGLLPLRAAGWEGAQRGAQRAGAAGSRALALTRLPGWVCGAAWAMSVPARRSRRHHCRARAAPPPAFYLPRHPPALPSFSPPLSFSLPLTFWPYLCWRFALLPSSGSVPGL